MQERRRREVIPLQAPSGKTVRVPEEYWNELASKEMREICHRVGATRCQPTGILLPFLNEYLLVDMETRKVCRQGHGRWEPVGHGLLELLCLVYLLHAGPEPLRDEMVTTKELRTAHFFTGPHALRTEPVLRRFGTDLQGFLRVCERMGGEPLDMADASFRFLAFPKVPVYYLLWQGDEEFGARVSILFDRSVECHLPPDAVWGLINLITDLLVA
jgi:hypothetical protein